MTGASDDGQAVTEADRATAHALWNEILCNGGVPGWTATGAIAAALAAERAKARAPFLALADELDAEVSSDPLFMGEVDEAHHDIANRIRRAAEEQQ